MKAIPPFRLVPQPLDEEASNLPKFKWAPKEIGHRHKLGGHPDFLQGENWPDCPDCAKRMTFYGQLDSNRSKAARAKVDCFAFGSQ
jgi:hypothetical protein